MTCASTYGARRGCSSSATCGCPRVVGRIDVPGPPTRATLEITPAAPVTLTVDATRVIVRVDADALDLTLPSAGGGLIDQIRPGDQPNTITVALNGRAGMARAASMDADNVTRVTVEVPPLNAPAETAAPPPPRSPAGGRAGLASHSPQPARPFKPSSSTPATAARTWGCAAPAAWRRKQITLEVARRLRGLIENRLGIRVVLTREEDRAVSLDERAAFANNSKADLFLSLHANAALAPAVAGAEVFHARLDRESEEALRSAEEGVALPVLGGGSRKIDVIRWDLAQARHVETSEMFAGMLEEDLRAHVTMGPRPAAGRSASRAHGR